MTWEIVLGIIAMCGAGVTLGGVLAKLVHTLTRLDVTLASLDKSVGEDRQMNISEHKMMCGRLENHEVRISSIEHGMEHERKG